MSINQANLADTAASTAQAAPTSHPAFELLRKEPVASLNLTVEEYRHTATGAMHYHLAADYEENVFLVALRTVPMDSTGVAHILEHTALCGSERYPVRDPFFMMLRRSLNTFMNAFTSSDWTAYPFASQNRKDFANLLDVYLDAVFFSRLDPLDFAQEGHRLEFTDMADANSALTYKGVVFNEMKGAMSSVPSQLWQALCKYLYPNTTYHYNSGGDPEHIPDLSYEELLAFYKTHYHPSNAIFMTFGDIPAAQHQQDFETKVLSRFEKLDEHIRVGNEKRYHAPVKVQESYAVENDEDAGDKTHVVVGWLLGESANLDDLLKAQLLSSVLLDNSASPLQKALETSELGNAPSPLCGLENSMRELTFVCGLEGCDSDSTAKVEALIIDTLKDVAKNGVEKERLDAVLHQLELHQREIGGDHYPYGLQLILSALAAATHDGDPIAMLNLDPAIDRLREACSNPDYIKQLARELLIDNPHRVTLTMTPDSQLNSRREAAEAMSLQKQQQQLSDADKQLIVEQALALAARQNDKGDESILPKVGLDDVPADVRHLHGSVIQCGQIKTTQYAQGTNGIIYQQIIFPLPALSDAELDLLPYYTRMLTEIGVGERDYLATQDWQAAVCGSISAYTSMRGTVSDAQSISGYLVLSGKALARNEAALAELMQCTLQQPRWNEYSRMRELVSQKRARFEQSIVGNGQSLAMQAACSGMSPLAKLTQRLSGMDGLIAIKALDKQLEDDQAIKTFAESLQTLHNKLISTTPQLLIVAEANELPTIAETLNRRWANWNINSHTEFSLPPVRETKRQLWVTNTQVNFCAKAYPTVPSDHPDAAALIVLGGFLRNGYLHTAIREKGGAYGGGASQDNNIAAFRFYSYRDPRLLETLNDFDAAINWMLTHNHDAESLEQAILGVIGSLDKPGSPAGEAKQTFHNELFGRGEEVQKRFRQRILAITLDDLKRVTQTYLQPDKASVAVLTSEATRQKLDKELAALNLETLTT